jgi:hypothetical protein
MLDAIVIVLKSRPRVVRGVNKHTLHLPRELLLQRLQRKQIVTEDESVIEDVVLADTMRSVIRPRWIFQQYAWLKAWTVFLTDPRQLEFLFPCHYD